MADLSLNIGLRALLSAKTALDTIGHNISNANTEGYSRQAVRLTASSPQRANGLIRGTGVRAESIQRSVDNILNRRLTTQTSSLGRFDASLGGMSEIESVLGEPGGYGIGSLLDDFFGSLSRLSASPQDSLLRTGVTQSIEAMALQFRSLAGDLEQTRQGAAQRVGLALKEVNALAHKISDLNAEISKAGAGGAATNDLQDRRDELLRTLAEQVDITYGENSDGTVRVLVAGQLLVGRSIVNEMRAEMGPNGSVQLFTEGATKPVKVSGGAIAGVLHVGQTFVPELAADIDALARNMILALNREHSTGVPADGGFTKLLGIHAIEDQDGDGRLGDETIGAAGLPFDVDAGELRVNVVNEASGTFETHVIQVDPGARVSELLDDLSAIDGISAALDSSGRVQLLADKGRTFDFGARLDAAPDAQGTFGGGRASLSTAGAGPFALAGGDTLDLGGPLGAFTITFDAADFQDPSKATAREIADVINADAGAVAAGLRAVAVGDRLAIQTQGSGAAESFDLLGGSAMGALGWTAPTSVSGHDAAVTVEIHGKYDGSGNDELVFRPTSDGLVGTTPELTVEVRRRSGELVGTLDVGEGYVPGSELEVADGVRVSFGFGELSAQHNDFFVEHLIADGDTSDVLVALGLNALLAGSDAATIGLREDIALDPGLLATSASGAAGDGGTLLRMLDLQTAQVDELGASFTGFYSETVSDVGFRIRSMRDAVEVETFLLDSLEVRRAEISGVNVDEELVDMIQFEQAFGAATQYIQVVQQLGDELLSMI